MSYVLKSKLKSPCLLFIQTSYLQKQNQKGSEVESLFNVSFSAYHIKPIVLETDKLKERLRLIPDFQTSFAEELSKTFL